MDMTDDRDELLVKRFFEENRVEMPDDGFSRHVMRQLPGRTKRISRIWTAVCSVVAVLFFIKNDFFRMLFGTFKGIANDVMTNDALRQSPQFLGVILLALLAFGGYKLIADEDF